MSQSRRGRVNPLVRVLCASAALLLSERSAGRDLSFRKITVREGLSQSSVYCVLQDRQGFLWIGTGDGLNRYDGYEFKVYRESPSDPTSISSSVVTSLAEDPQGNIWAGTLQGGLSRYDPRTDRFVRFRHRSDDARSLASDKVYSVLVGRDGSVWAGTSGGLNRFDPQTQSFVRYRHDPGNPDSLSHDKALSIAEDLEGRLWVGTIGGALNRLDRERRRFVHYDANPGAAGHLASDWISALLVDRAGAVWVGTKGGGLSRYDPSTDAFVTYRHDPADPSSISSDLIWSLCESPLQPGVLWIGTFGGGLCRHESGSSAFERFTHDPHDETTVGDDQVSALRQDRGGVLWIGTWTGGLSALDLAGKRFVNYRSERDPSRGLTNNVVFGLTEDRSGILWIGTYGGGLCAAFPAPTGDRTFRCYRSVPGDPTTLSDDVVTELCEDRAGRLWIGTNGGGLNRFDAKTATFRRFRLGPGEAKNLGANVVYALTEDPDGQLLIGTEARGLLRFDPKTGKSQLGYSLTGGPSTLDDSTVTQFLWDRDGKLWIFAGDSGLYRWDPVSRRLDRYDPGSELSGRGKVIVMFQDRAGTFWLGTGAGLVRFDPSTGATVRYTGEKSMPSGVITGILEDEDGNLWLGTNRGLARFDPRRKTFRSYDQADGVLNVEFNTHSRVASRSGELYFGGTEGVTAFDPRSIRDNPFVPPVAITAIRRGNEELRTATSSAFLDRLELPYGENALGIDFAALSFAHPEKNRFAYKIEGLTGEWIDLGSRHGISLAHLEPGSFVLRIKGASHDGAWNERGASLRIVVGPPFHRTWWFLDLAAAAFAAASYVVINLTRRYLRLVAFWKIRTYVGHYRLLGTIGSGGMGVVYKAADVMDRSRLFAVKVLREEDSDDPVLRRRFLNEAALIDQLDHPNIVKVVERGEADRRLFMAMELLPGATLAARIAEGRTIPLAVCLSWMGQLAGAVSKVHARGIVHRDLKPENVMLVPGEDGETVKLLDFGLARAQTLTRLTETGMIIGSINYLAPEQISDRSCTTASDVYSLGVIFFELVTLEKPFLGETAVDVIKQILEKEPLQPKAFRPDLPEELDVLILAMMSKRPASRPSGEAVCSSLRLLVDEREGARLSPASLGASA